MTKKMKDEMFAKNGLAYILDEIVDGWGKIYFDEYEKDSDRVTFKFDGHKCRLLELHKVNLVNGTITMRVLVDGFVKIETLDFNVQHFRYNTLYKIVLESYMCGCVCSEFGDDGDGYIKEKLADYFDTFYR